MVYARSELEKFQKVLELEPCAAALFEIDTANMIFVNTAYCKILGYDLEEYWRIHKYSQQNNIFSSDKITKKNSAEEFRKHGTASNYEYRVIDKDGSLIWLKMSASTIELDDVEYAFASFTDITKEKEAYAQFKMIVENTGSSVSMFRVKNGIEELIYANDAFFELLGVPRETYEKDVHAFDEKFVSKEDNERIKNTIVFAYEHDQPGEVEHQFIKPSGEHLWLNRRYRIVKQEDTDTYIMISVVTDRTEKKKAEIQERLEQRRFKLVADEMNIAVIEWDADGSNFYSSSAYQNYAISKVPPKDILQNKGPSDIIHPDDQDLMMKFFVESGSGEDRVDITLRIKMMDESFHWCHIIGFFYRDELGNPTHTIGVLEDVNEEHERSFMLNNLLNELPGGVAIFKVAERLECQYFSDGFAAMSGRSRSEVEAAFQDDDVLNEIIPLENYYDFIRSLRENKVTGKTLSFTYHYRQNSGEIGWLHVAALKIREEQGLPVYYCIYTNPTDETTLYRNIVEDSAIGVYIADRKNGTILYSNSALSEICGLDSKKFTGQTKDNLLKAYDKKELLTQEEIMNLSLEKYSEFHVTRRGLYLAIKAKALIWNGIDSYVLYIADETTEHAHQIELQKNIEELRKNRLKEKALLESILQEQKHYRQVLNMLDIAYWEWSKEGGFYSSSNYDKYALSRASSEELRSSRVYDGIVHPEDMPLLEDFLNQGNEKQRRCSTILRMLMVDGTYQWTEILGLREYDEMGRPVRISCTLRDMNEEWIRQKLALQEALDEAKRANEAKTVFISRISHDMRTPLNGILGLTSFLKDTVTDEQAKKDISQLELSGQYLLNLINDTLDISRIENGKLELHPVVCNGRTVFRNLVKLMKPNIEAKHLKFQMEAENIPFTMLKVDVVRVQQIIMNIVGNAVKFTPEYGTIDFRIEHINTENGIETDKIWIKDSGIGMSKDFLPHLFEAFSQADDTKANTKEGTGLGMAITKKLVDLMGGEIVVESELGQGSCFILTLPMKLATEDEVAEWKESQKHEENESILADKRILLCEDHPLNREIATRMLQTKQIKVESAENGSVALEMFEKSEYHYYDIIIMDIQMPVKDGVSTTKEIRSMDRPDARTIPIIAMTGNSFDEDVKRSFEAGMNAHLSKPINPEILFTTLVEQLEARQE